MSMLRIEATNVPDDYGFGNMESELRNLFEHELAQSYNDLMDCVDASVHETVLGTMDPSRPTRTNLYDPAILHDLYKCQ